MKKTKDFKDTTTIDIDIDNLDINVSLENLAYRYKASGLVDCEMIRFMDAEDLIAVLYNLATNLFELYKYNKIPYQKYIQERPHPEIRILHNIKYNDVERIKRMLCQY